MDIKKLIDKYKDIILYLFFGICTTAVNVIIYTICAYPLNIGTISSSIIAWIFAVLFAYVTNRKWVFYSEAITNLEKLKELLSFLGCRLTTGVVDWACMFIFVLLIGLNDVNIKFAANILIIILNYAAGKWIVFKHKYYR